MARLTEEQIRMQLNKAAAKEKETQVTFDDIDSFGNRESLMAALKSISSYNKMLEQRITLINEPLTATVPFTRENLYLFCAFTGSGKSTVAANISLPLWKQGKKVLVIANEEPQHDILFRIGCLDLGLNFNDYKKGKMANEDQLRVAKLFPEISKFVKILDVTYRDGLTTKVEGIKSALNSVKDKDYSCVLIDYYQLIKYSVSDPQKTSYDNLNDLRLWMGQYIKSSNVPIVLFAQLYSSGKKGGVKDIDARIKECSAVVEPATVIIEVVPNFEAQTTDFIIHKDRFGFQGHRITCGFEKGRYTKISPEEAIMRASQGKLKKANEDLDKIEGIIFSEDSDAS
jgi:replicative DNA helicase